MSNHKTATLTHSQTGVYCPFIHAAGDGPPRKAWSMPQRRCTHWLLITSRGGDEQITVAGTTYAVPRNGSYLIHPGLLADIGSRGGNSPVWLHFDLHYDPRRAEHPQVHAYDPELGRRRRWLQADAHAVFGVDLPVLIDAAWAERFAEATKRIVALWRLAPRQPVQGLVAACELGHLLASYAADLASRSAASTSSPAASHEHRLHQAEAAALNHGGSSFTIADMARAAGFGRSRFCAVYRQQRGCGPGAFLRRCRIQRAERLLTGTSLSIGEVATLCGYADAAVFARAFRSVRKVGPRTWRRSVTSR